MYDKEIRDAWMVLERAGFKVTPPRKDKELLPMLTHDKFSIPQYHKVNIEIGDANHFLRTLRFADDNELRADLGRRFLDLMLLLIQTSGKPIPRKSWEPEDTPQQYEPGQARIYPDGYLDPGFGWSGCGMVGGFIFHRQPGEWSIHT